MVRPATAVAALVLCLAFAALASASTSPVATAAAKCSVKGKERDLGTTYVTSVKANDVSCRRALQIVKAYHRCRHHNGGADGKCRRTEGYRCSERKLGDSPTQYDARATCKRDGRSVVQVYTQNK